MSARHRVLACALAVATGLATMTANALPAGASAPVPAKTASDHTVTLITGDRVTATPLAGGQFSLSLASRGTRYAEFTRTQSGTTDRYLVPAAAGDLVESGVLDLELFNVTGLIRQGYDDAATDAVPLLIEHADLVAAAIPAGARTDRSLPDLSLTAVATPKKETNRLWRSLTGIQGLAASPAKVWLNAKIRTTLDVSVPQVGAPAAWQAGHTGRGVTVAVLDSGIDTTHPDLAGKVVHAKDFAGSGDLNDRNGHGTHVAATIVAGGKYKGVAPDARIANGKVTDEQGFGQLDDILAGMRWAAGEVKAKVVNMSLGGGPSDGTDPLSTAVNTLTAKYGTLFVVAAGNQGTDQSVTTPAAADAALAVGSVTKSGQLSDFSSRGPRLRDGAVKPEIVAPGSDIVAAKAEHARIGEVVEDRYLRLSGTSMAAPHVAGGAAILAGQHPEWTAERLKAALVGTATPVSGADVYAAGGGRMDLARATTATVQAVPAAANTFLAWGDSKVHKRKVTYHNSGPTPVTLTLDLRLSGQVATLSATTVTIAAGGRSDVTILATRGTSKPGDYRGFLVASGADGKEIRTPVSVSVESEMYELTVTLLDRTGKNAENSKVWVFGIDDRWQVHQVANNTTLRLPAARYLVVGAVETPQPGRDPSTTMLAHPSVQLNRNTGITMDARTASRVTVRTDQPEAKAGAWTHRMGTQRASGPRDTFSLLANFDPRFSEVYAGTQPGVSAPTFLSSNNLRLEEARTELFVEKPRRLDVDAWPMSSRVPAVSGKYALVHGGQGRPEDLAAIDVRDKFVVLDLPADLDDEEIVRRAGAVRDRGGAMVASSVLAERGGLEFPLPTFAIRGAGATTFADLAGRGDTEASLIVRDSTRFTYELSFPEVGRVPENLDYRVRTADLAAVTMAFHSSTAEGSAELVAYHRVNDFDLSTYSVTATPVQAERLIYFTPADWRLGVDLTQSYPLPGLTGWHRFEAGKAHRVTWNAPVAGPGFIGSTDSEVGLDVAWGVRKANLMDFTIPVFSDSAGHARPAEGELEVDTGFTALYRNGQPLGTHNLPARGTFPVPSDLAEYRLVTEVSRTQPWWPNSTKVFAAWTFRSELRGGGFTHALPLLAVGFAPTVDLRNLAPGGRESTIPITVTRQDATPRIQSVEVDVSYDDGETWATAPVSGGGTQFTATVVHPATGYVSLRTRARDDNGNSLEQTVIRAYQLGS